LIYFLIAQCTLPATPTAARFHVNLKHFGDHIRLACPVPNYCFWHIREGAWHFRTAVAEGADSGDGFPVIYCRRQLAFINYAFVWTFWLCGLHSASIIHVHLTLRLLPSVTKNATKDTRISSVILNLFGRAFLFVKLSVYGQQIDLTTLLVFARTKKSYKR